jgi:hypothetical protein
MKERDSAPSTIVFVFPVPFIPQPISLQYQTDGIRRNIPGGPDIKYGIVWLPYTMDSMASCSPVRECPRSATLTALPSVLRLIQDQSSKAMGAPEKSALSHPNLLSQGTTT